LGRLLKEKIRSISEVQGVENYGGKLDGVESESLEVRYGGKYTSKEFKVT